jgi:hypothetical protein
MHGEKHITDFQSPWSILPDFAPTCSISRIAHFQKARLAIDPMLVW